MAELNEASIKAFFDAEVGRIGVALQEVLLEDEFPITQGRVPVEYETLKGTGYVSEPEVVGDTVTVTMGYGTNEDETGIYAIVQENRNDFNHPRGGQAHYMGQTVNEGEPTLLERLAAKLK